MTDKYDPNNERHKELKWMIEIGDGLPDISSTQEVKYTLFSWFVAHQRWTGCGGNEGSWMGSPRIRRLGMKTIITIVSKTNVEFRFTSLTIATLRGTILSLPNTSYPTTSNTRLLVASCWRYLLEPWNSSDWHQRVQKVGQWSIVSNCHC